jgi:alpha-galactosidase
VSADPRALGRWCYVTSPTLKDALEGADFVAISILPGTFEHMRSDVHLPERLGVYQPVGDTTGPGGIIRALRTIPMYVEFAEAVRDYAPNAWVVNYTNPMALCVRTLYEVFPKIKAFGCCHEVFNTQALLAAAVRRELGGAASRSDICVNVLGLNHFTWFDRASYAGHDLTGLYARFIEEFYETGYKTEPEKPDSVFTCRHRVKFDLFREYGLIAAAGDRHLAEFMPGERYLKSPETVEKWGFYLTPVDWRVGDRAEKVAKTARLVSGEESLEFTHSGEEGVVLIKALLGLTRVVSNVNLPNAALQIGNLPRETVVETNALFSYDDVRPVAAGALSHGLSELFAPHIENQTETLNAALSCDFEAVVRAFSRDPLLKGRCSDADIRKLARDMLRGTRDVLPEGWGI